MVLRIDGRYVTCIMLRSHGGKWVFSENKVRFVNALDRFKCLKQIKK